MTETLSGKASKDRAGSSLHRQGDAYGKEPCAIFKEERAGERAKVTLDEERGLRSSSRQ